jgi:hypothetical protein
MNTNINVDNIEEEINQEFHKQIKELPEEYKDPVENTLEYIKKRAKCNDYEAAQIQLLMNEQSAQKTGYKYYCRYIAGLSTPEEDNADYYKSIRKSWNKFLDKYAVMSTEERVEALTVDSASVDKVSEVLGNADPEKLDFISKKTKVSRDQIERISDELSSKKTLYLVTHVDYTQKKLDELNTAVETFNKKIISSAEEYNILEGDSKIGDDKTPYDKKSAAYSNIVKSMDTIRSINKNVSIFGGTKDFDGMKKRLEKFDIVQIIIDSSKENIPMYKYAAIKEVNGDDFLVDIIDLKVLTSDGGVVDIDKELGNNKDYSVEIDHINLNSKEDIELKGNKLTSDNFKYYIEKDPEYKYRHNLSDLHRIYQRDATFINQRLENIIPNTDKATKALGAVTMGIGIGITAIGLIIASIGAIFFLYNKFKKTDEASEPLINTSDTDKGSSTKPDNVKKDNNSGTWISSGLGIALGGVATLAIGAHTVDTADKVKKERNKEINLILKDMQKHNNF